ncbi:hypothetical protein AAFF_G00333280 [Aldrovandia affinis]|uniref:Nucleoplasmin core domain-containing protein n=1 Tax=Aldrovandia affinis TaxID=143900 RepID=A0AAD7SLR6_9TELE|nr:hypothetical protein AAFF_G00333280 [Aldrovandia affinis]
MSFTEDESSESGRVGPTRMESYFFSCELSSQVPFYTFQGDEDENVEHYLDLRTVCLGAGAKEESNVVEVTALNHRGKKVSVPVANLHVSCLPMVSMGEFEVKAPVTFRLKSGTGPVCVSGLHLVAYEDDVESDVSEDLEEIDDDIIPIKPAKKKQKL